MTPTPIPSDILRQALAGLAKVLSTKTTLPVLSTVRIAAHRGAVTFTATNLDQQLTYTHRTEPVPITAMACKLAEMRWARSPAEGVCVPLFALRAAAKGKGDALLAADRITFTTAAGETTVPFEGIALAEFPMREDAAYLPVCTLDGADRAALTAAAAFMSEDETRFVLNGVLLDTTGDVVSTDGRRLYHCPLSVLAMPEAAIVPAAVFAVLGLPAFLAREWTLLFAKGVDTVRPPHAGAMIRYDKALAKWEADKWKAAPDKEDKPEPPEGEKIPGASTIRFAAGPWQLTSKLIEGNFPNWKQVVPTYAGHEEPATITFTPEMAAQLRAILAAWPCQKTEGAEGITLFFPGTGMRLVDKAGTVHMLPGVRSSAPVAFALNRHYFADAIALGTPTLQIIEQDRCMDVRCGTARVIIMPMRTGSDIPIEDAAKEEAEAQWKDCHVRLGYKDNHEGLVNAITRKGTKLYATVSAGPDSEIKLVPLAEMKLLKRPTVSVAADEPLEPVPTGWLAVASPLGIKRPKGKAKVAA